MMKMIMFMVVMIIMMFIIMMMMLMMFIIIMMMMTMIQNLVTAAEECTDEKIAFWSQFVDLYYKVCHSFIGMIK